MFSVSQEMSRWVYLRGTSCIYAPTCVSLAAIPPPPRSIIETSVSGDYINYSSLSPCTPTVDNGQDPTSRPQLIIINEHYNNNNNMAVNYEFVKCVQIFVYKAPEGRLKPPHTVFFFFFFTQNIRLKMSIIIFYGFYHRTVSLIMYFFLSSLMFFFSHLL